MRKLGPFREPETKRLLGRILELKAGKHFADAERAGEAATREHPADTALLAEHAETAIRRKTWGSAIKRLDRLIQLEKQVAARNAAVLRLAGVYVGLGQPAEAENILKKALLADPADLTLRKAHAELSLLDPARRFDGHVWQALAAAAGSAGMDQATRVSVITACVAGLRLTGHGEEASILLELHFRPGDRVWTEGLKDGFAKLVVFDNGSTRVEYLTKLFDPETGGTVAPRQLAVTFDIMDQTWDRIPFAYRPLSPESIDFLAVRKRTKEDYHQDFRREDFLAFALPVAARYDDVVAVGQSLGGYCALYYASLLPGCRILATAPRNPLHPRYAGKRYASYKLFIHEYEMAVNTSVRPTIAYDPKNSEDAGYVEKSLSISFPGAVLLRYPNCGHSITRYLRDVGDLKNATLGFFKGKAFPAFDRSKRGGSSEYLRNLAKQSLRSGRAGRARRLALRALELGFEPELTHELLVKIDAALGASQAGPQVHPGEIQPS